MAEELEMSKKTKEIKADKINEMARVHRLKD